MTDRLVIADDFSLRMLQRCFHELTIEPLNEDCVRDIIQQAAKEDGEILVSAVGSKSNAKRLSEFLGVDIPASTNNYVLQCGDKLFVGIPEESLILWWLIKFV